MTSAPAQERIPFEINSVVQGEAIRGLMKLPAESVDLIVTDPPYNIASRNKTTLKNGRPISTAEAWGEWDTYHPFDYDVLMMELIREAHRVLRPGGAIYCFTAREYSGFFIRKAQQRGFVFRNQLAIVKKNPLPSLAKSNWRSGYELCAYLTKGKPRRFNFLSQQECVNTFNYSNSKKVTTHPTEKPQAFCERLILASSEPGDLILDPFAGSGTTLAAAQATNRRFLGFDRSSLYVAMAQARLKI